MLSDVYKRQTQNRRYANDEEWQKERDLERHKVQVIKQKMDACPLFISWGYGEAPILSLIHI